jgi:DNA topoisomerase 2-associated protein PAT1
MSFFDFDPMAPPAGSTKPQTLDFNDMEEDDAFNDETFGATAVSNLDEDFNFSLGGLNDNKPKQTYKPAPIPTKNASVSYAKAAHTSVDEVLQPMASLWSDEKPSNTAPQEQKPNVLSLEEIEAKLKTQNLPSQPQQFQQFQQLQQQQQPQPQQLQQQQQPQINPNMMQNNMQFQIPPYITQILLQPAVHQQILSAVSSGRFPDIQSATLAMVQMLMTSQNQMMQMGHSNLPIQYGNSNNMNMPPNVQQMTMPPHHQQQQQPQQPQQQQQQQPQQASPSQTSPSQESQNTQLLQLQQQPPPPPKALHNIEKHVNSDEFPSIEVASAKSAGHVNHNDSNTKVPQFENDFDNENNEPNQNQNFNQRQNRSFYNQSSHNNQRNIHNNYNFNRHQQLQQQMEHMSPQDREHFLIRQQKVQKITRCSGFMTPKDKDFVTRFQLSQIVTDDPYNEDFYSQVYKVLNSSIDGNNMNSLAQKYLEQSGHRLGGRSKRADIALQRMQQQVSKAVSVAKERGESTGILTKAGALGKVSFGSGKQPRKQLIINNPETETEKSTKIEFQTQNELVLPKEFTFSKSARSFQLSIIEKIYNEVLKLESLERENQLYETIELWNSLHLNDIIKTSSNEIVNPFISLLAFDKMMKLFGRIFHFLTSEQKIELISQIFIHLQNIDVIRKGSYKNYENSNFEIPDDVTKKIDLFQLTVLKNLVLYLSDSSFNYVLSWLNALVTSKNVLFLVTTKIGLSLITVLISRLELIKQEFSTSLSVHELSQWQTVYDQLFQSLEGRITSCFPPYISHDETRKIKNKDSNEDDSYIWQFLASLSLTGQLNHQRIIVDEIRNEIFGVMAVAKELKANADVENATRYLGNLNLFLNAMGLIATEDDITQLSD